MSSEIDLTDSDIVSKLGNFEDQFVERKTSSDTKDWLKTAVAFANSCPIGHPGLLLIGVQNDGTIEHVVNLDKLQRTLTQNWARLIHRLIGRQE